ncbi:MAG: hypothetical protein ACR2OZ_08690 [Verrucomicrobiales bacterium]
MSEERSIFDVLSDALREGPGRFLLIGGYSLEAYGYRRITDDTDLLVASSDFPWMERTLTHIGYRRAVENPTFCKFTHVTLAMQDVDVMFVNEQTFEKLWSASQIFQRGNARLRVPLALHLIALKLHAIKNNPQRLAKDRGDILELINRNRDRIDDDSLRAICDRFGPAGIFDHLKDLLP